MTIKTFIEKAIEGGWKPTYENSIAYARGPVDTDKMWLDPEAWKAVGKATGNEHKCGMCGEYEGGHNYRHAFYNNADWWLKSMHQMIDALAEGKTIEQYLETLN